MGRHAAPRRGYAWWSAWPPRRRRERRYMQALLAGWDAAERAGEKHE